MEYEITDERRNYLDARGYIIVTACPGSGKTTSIVAKLRNVAQYCADQYGRHTGFACLSFTNKACSELKDKYKVMHEGPLRFPNVVSTIDSFIMQMVVLPFWYLCDLCKKKPVVVNDSETLNRLYYVKYSKNGTWNETPIQSLRSFGQLPYNKMPAKVSRNRKGYAWNHNDVEAANDIAYCEAAFKYRLEKGFINSSDALWIACDILESHAEVARAITKRFPYIIVDEAQDNSDLHFHFFQLLKDAGLENLEFVGDACQSIYGFREADPSHLKAMINSGEWTVLPLSECRRSNQRIIDVYSKLRPAGLNAITSLHVEDKGVPIIVYKYDDLNVKDTIQDFHQRCDDCGLKSRSVLARGVSDCKKLAGVKDLKFKYWKDTAPYLIINAVFEFEAGEMDSAFRRIRLLLSRYVCEDEFDYEARRKYVHKVENDVQMNAKIFSFMQRIPSLSLSFTDWTDQTTALLQSHFGLRNRPEFVVYKRQDGYVMREEANRPVEYYHSSSECNSKFHRGVETIHSVKGATLDAVLLFLSFRSYKESISLKDFPRHQIATMNERQRMIYVACSRATQFLAFAVPSNVNDADIDAAFNGIEIEKIIIKPKGELNFDTAAEVQS